MKTLTRLLLVAAVTGAAVSVLARMLGSRARPSNQTDAAPSPALGKAEPLRVPLGELVGAQGSRWN